MAIAVSIFNDVCKRLGRGHNCRYVRSHFLRGQGCIPDYITAERETQMVTKESRKRKRLKRLGRDEDQAGRDGFPYWAGAC